MAISDCWSDVLRSTYDTSLVLFHDYRKGLYSPGLDRFARTAVLGPNVWQSGVPGKSLAMRTPAVLSVADAGVTPELSLTAGGTIILFTRPGGWQYTGATRLTYKVTGATGFDFVVGNTGQMYLSTSTGASLETGSLALLPNIMLGVSWTTGVVPVFYGNGRRRFAGNLVATVTADASTLYIAQLAGGFPIQPALQGTLIFNAQLSGEQISQLYTDWLYSPFAL